MMWKGLGVQRGKTETKIDSDVLNRFDEKGIVTRKIGIVMWTVIALWQEWC